MEERIKELDKRIKELEKIIQKSDEIRTFENNLLFVMNDKYIAKRIYEMIQPTERNFTLEEKDIIKEILNYWNEISETKCNKLFYADKLNLLKAVDNYSQIGLKKLLDKIIKSPLAENSLQKVYVTDLLWILKEQNLDKIQKGYYDEKKGKYDDLFEED